MITIAAKATVLFPLLLPVWTERPFVAEDLFPGPYPLVATPQELAFQEQVYDHVDRALRSQIARQLRETQTALAFAILCRALERESDVPVQATLLQQLAMMDHESADLPGLVTPFLEHDNEDLRGWAVSLYGRLRECRPEVLLQIVQNDPAEAVCLQAAHRLADQPDQTRVLELAALADNSNVRIRVLGIAALCTIPGPVAQNTVAARRDDKHPAVRAAIAAKLPCMPATAAGPTIDQLAEDAHATVRGAVARAIGERRDATRLGTLLTLLKDHDDDVRRHAAAAARHFTVPDSRDALVERLEDRRRLVRNQVEDTLAAMDASLPVNDAVAARLTDPLPRVRCHVCRLLGRLGYRQYANDIADLLERETEPENIAAAVGALGALHATVAEPRISAHAEHPEPEVRTAVAKALGRIGVPAAFDHLRTLAFDTEETVRQAALYAMGVIGDGNAFAPTLLRALKTVDGVRMTGENRACAAWSAGRLRPLNDGLMERLVVQATTPVVPDGSGALVFEQDHILASLAFALVQCARDDPHALPAAENVLAMHARTMPDDPAAFDPAVTTFSAEVNEAARQARAFLGDHTPQPAPRPTRNQGWIVKPVSPDQP